MAVVQSFTLMLIPRLVIQQADHALPLEYKEGRKTDTIHNCPNKKQNGSLTAIATTEMPKKSNIDNVDLSVIKMIAALNDYITIKEKA